MRLVTILQLRLRSLFDAARVESDMDEELRYHLERLVDENVSAGMSREAARFAALRSMGGMEQRKEECRDARGWNPIRHLPRDLRFAARQLRRSPEFTATAVLMLGLGICFSTAIFGFVDAALIKPLPYRSPERLLGVFEKVDPGCPRCNLSWLDYLDWKKRNSTLASLDVFARSGSTLTASSGALPVHAARVSD